jgi:MSHA pilin protein MshC
MTRHDERRPGRGHPCPAAAFTVTELVVVIGMLAIVAAVAAPRFLDFGEFDARFYYEEVRAAVAHAQKLAVASGCEVQVTLNGSGFELRQRASCTTGSFTQTVRDPATGAPPYSAAPPGSVTLSSTLSPIVFDALGRANDSGGNVSDATVTVGSRQFETVGETGLVHAGS